MKVLPASETEIQDMAESLLQEWIRVGLPLYLSDDQPQRKASKITLIKERMAMAFGWSSWKELITKVSEPHTPVYLDESEDGLNAVVLKLSNTIGYNYAHGWVFRAVENAGAGFSPELRIKFKELATPWGQIQDSVIIASGIEEVTTAGHGGIILSEARYKEMPKHLRMNSLYYEEDDAAVLVELAFPEHFKDRLKYALCRLSVYEHDNSIDSHLNEQEQEVVTYLAKCVFHNKSPIRVPASGAPSLKDLVDCLSIIPKVGGDWPLSKKPWAVHFCHATE